MTSNGNDGAHTINIKLSIVYCLGQYSVQTNDNYRVRFNLVSFIRMSRNCITILRSYRLYPQLYAGDPDVVDLYFKRIGLTKEGTDAHDRQSFQYINSIIRSLNY